MTSVIITSFCLGLIFGGILTAAVAINELNHLRKMLSEEKQIGVNDESSGIKSYSA
jgi:hypothetical protein